MVMHGKLFIAVFLATTLLSAPQAYAGVRAEDAAMEETVLSCTAVQAVEAARAETAKFCSGPNGCDYTARPTLTHDKKQYPDAVWNIMVSQIFSFGKNGEPQFGPEGTEFVRVGKDCSVFEIMGHHYKRRLGE
jgi:hypothetical protein